MNSNLCIVIVLSTVGFALSFGDFKGECKTHKVGLGRKCTKYDFYEVKQCRGNADTCQCVDAWDGTVVARVKKEDECPPCLLANAEEYQFAAEGGVDGNSYRCASDGYYDDENVECQWFACFCYTRDGDVARSFDFDEINDETSCKTADENREEE